MMMKIVCNNKNDLKYMKKITLYDYLLWIAEDENNITSDLIAENLMLDDMYADQIMDFYNKHKNDELKKYKEEYPNGNYRGIGFCDTTVSFYMDGKFYKLTDVNGSYINDMGIDINSLDSTQDNIDSIKSMNKIMFFMANCGYTEVKKLVNDVFDSHIANHILYKYDKKINYTNNAFFNLYFEVDSDCKKKICEYILNNYDEEPKLYKL
jgi:hypothetical protein